MFYPDDLKSAIGAKKKCDSQKEKSLVVSSPQSDARTLRAKQMALDGFTWLCTQAQSAWQRPNADSRAICEINFQPNDPIRTVSRRSNLSFAAGARGDDHDAMLD